MEKENINSMPIIEIDDFVRRFSARQGKLMWFLGAGASIAAGVPSAWNMIQEFKQKLYTSKNHISPKAVSDLSNPAIHSLLQSFIDNTGSYPSEGTPEEYAALFEAVCPTEIDRRNYIEEKISLGKPSYGHIALATLMQNSWTRMIWTTNFDHLIADACSKVYGSTLPLTSVDLDSSTKLPDLISNERWPIEIKLHGDFRSRRLKNTTEELKQQDEALREQLINTCQRFGLIVAGYSGRDASIMETIEKSLNSPSPFPYGLFWLCRGKASILPAVSNLIDRAVAQGVECMLVNIESFDETLRDIISFLPSLDTSCIDNFGSRSIWSAAPTPIGSKEGFPIVRLNALKIAKIPSLCRFVECSIAGQKELDEAIARFGNEIFAVRISSGVLAFGDDADIKGLLNQYGITEFNDQEISLGRLSRDPQKKSLIRQVLSHGLAKKTGMGIIRKHNKDFLFPKDIGDPKWNGLRTIVRDLSGTLPRDSSTRWREGISFRLELVDGELWLTYEPRIIFNSATQETRYARTEFANKRTAKRYNKQLNSLLSFWGKLLTSEGKSVSLGVQNGLDAIFEIETQILHSWRWKG